MGPSVAGGPSFCARPSAIPPAWVPSCSFIAWADPSALSWASLSSRRPWFHANRDGRLGPGVLVKLPSLITWALVLQRAPDLVQDLL